MANALYGQGREHFLGGDLDWDANTIRAGLADSAVYTTVLIDVDNDIADVPAGARVPALIANWTALTTKTKALGVADADDSVLVAVTGAVCEYIILFMDSGTEGTSLLIAFWDSFTGAPVTPNGGNITIQWAATSPKIFKL
jgi:hypothetical protein